MTFVSSIDVGFFGFIHSFQSKEILFYDEKNLILANLIFFVEKSSPRVFLYFFLDHTSCSKIDGAKIAEKALSGNVSFTKESMVQKKDIKKISVKASHLGKK